VKATKTTGSSAAATNVSAGLLADLYAALNRLVLGSPVIVKPRYKINMKTVCDEAGRDRSSIKTHKGFEDIREAICKAKKATQSPHHSSKADLDTIRQLEERNRSLRRELSLQDEKLTEASETIYRLYLQLHRMEEDREYLLAKVQSARITSQAVEKAFRVIGFDRFIAQNIQNR
jgi:hypothetical protein